MSHATVSRALHDHAAISAPTKARVREAAQRLGYIPNSGARALRQHAEPADRRDLSGHRERLL
jgi:LacI family repressor for deo operon, udp, cdd, tsx, nupC, and nupG